MAKATFDTDGLEGTFSKDNMNNQHFAVFQGDWAGLRPRAQATPDMTIAVGAAVVEGYFRHYWLSSTAPLSYAGGNSPAISAPVGNSRIDLLYIKPDNTLAWVTGTESGSPTIPSFIVIGIPICAVWCRTTMTGIVNYEDKDANPTQGYVYADLRPAIEYATSKKSYVWFIGSNVAAGIEQGPRVKLPSPFLATVLRATAYVKTAPVGADIVIDINVGGVSILSIAKLRIPAGSKDGSTTSFATTSLVTDNVLTIDLDSVGTTTPGADLTVILEAAEG